MSTPESWAGVCPVSSASIPATCATSAASTEAYCPVLGPNGAGKTTPVRILATLMRPDGGHATIGGHDIVKDPVRVRQLIGLDTPDTAEPA